MNALFKTCIIGFSVFGFAFQANAAPVLRDQVTVISPIVTVGDMFEDAGIFAEQALFRSPAPGTIGQVSIQSVRIAAAKIGIEDFENPGLFNVSVSRTGISVDLTTFEDLISSDLEARGILRSGMSVHAFLSHELGPLFAQESAAPVTLQNLRYIPANNRFSARFLLAGQARPIDISGRLDFSILAPHLVRSLSAGVIIQASDIEMRELPLQFASAVGVADINQLVGHQLLRNQLDGATLRLSDVIEPVLITRNQIVTLYLKSGAMTLTVRGQALADAAKGETVAVLNLLSNKIVQGIASNPGTVQIHTTSERIASL